MSNVVWDEEEQTGEGPVEPTGGDALQSAFEAVAEAGEATAGEARALAEHAHRAAEQRAQGATVVESMASGQPLEVLGLSERMAKRLLSKGAVLRKALMVALAREGTGVSAISRLFGVSHQRVSALLQKSRPQA